MKKYDAIAYAQSFLSFATRKGFLKNNIKEIILFGSALRDELDKKSDIDLFVNAEKDLPKIQQIIKEMESAFYKTKEFKEWGYRGIQNKISIIVGDLKNWKLQSSIKSEGIILYSKYKESPSGLENYHLIHFNPIKNIAKRNKVIRKLYGRAEKDQNYSGMIKQSSGQELDSKNFIVPAEKSSEIISFLNDEKVSYTIREVWVEKL